MKEQQAQPTSNSRSRGKLGALALACFQLPGPSEVRPDQVRRGGVLRRPFVNSSAPLSTFLLLALILTPFRAAAMTGIEQEENISDLLPVTFPSEESARDPATRSWAILPQVGYGPDTGFLGGVKFVERDLFDSGTSLDLGGFYATERQQNAVLSVASPLFQNGRLLVLARAKFRLDPRVEFFGIGNNDIGPDYVSTHAMEEIGGALTVGWRPFERLAFNFGLGVRRVDVWCDCVNNPCTVGLYPDLPGVGGGMVNYLNLSLVWNNRDAVVRPTRGWRVIFKVVHTNEAILSDYTFTRLALDSGYLRSFFDDSLVIGLRFNGEWVTGPERDIPFWELTSLGGDDTLRGFYPNRFLGKGRLLINGEARFLLTDFVFVKLWRIRIDGVVFGDGGRVFINKDDLDEEFSLDTELIGRVLSGLQYSYGCGLRFAIARSLVARIDAGFSNEETGLIYLSFGQTF